MSIFGMKRLLTICWACSALLLISAHEVAGIAIIESLSNGRAFGRVDLSVDKATGRVLGRHIVPPHEMWLEPAYAGSPVLFNINGTHHAIDAICLHQGGPLAEGLLAGSVVTCPWHGWQFDVTTGTLVQDSSTGVTCHEARVVDGKVQIRLKG